jgi:hypothetical protein
MTDQPGAKESRPELDKGKNLESGTIADAELPLDPDMGAAVTDKPATSPTLTPEEQMALYEKDLKENDWGHQPC